MTKVTADTITDEQIRELQRESTHACDWEAMRTCDSALTYGPPALAACTCCPRPLRRDLERAQQGGQVAMARITYAAQLALIVAWLVAIAFTFTGCAVDEPAPTVRYSCAVLYECHGDVDPRALTVLPCAGDTDEANDRATDLGMVQAAARCGDRAWTYVRTFCEAQAPATTCDVATE